MLSRPVCVRLFGGLFIGELDFFDYLLRVLMREAGVLIGLPGELVGGEVIILGVGGGGLRVSVRCNVVKLCDAVMSGLRHGDLLGVLRPWMRMA